MSVFYDLTKLPHFRNPVLTIGSFDGVHHGHKAILQQVVSEAQKINGESILITFYPHPRKIIHPELPLGLLSAPEQKMKLITQQGIDHIVVVPFSREFSMMPAEDYIDNFLWKNFQPKVIVLGYDHHFGHDRKGNIDLLKERLSSRVFISEIPAQLIEDAAVSSTKIRKALLSGSVELANEMLERFFSVKGTVIHGEKKGRQFGFPTANLRLDYSDILIPAQGVYIVNTLFEEKSYPSMMSIGVRPTITDKNTVSLEVNILDFNQDIYGQDVEIQFLHYLRPEVKCASVQELIDLMKTDESNTRKFFAGNN